MSTLDVTEDLFTVEVITEQVTAEEVFVELTVIETEQQDAQIIMEGGQGPAGKSAYQSAVALGFIGTEAQWIESLGGAVIYLGKTLVRENGRLSEIRLYEDAEKTILSKTLHLVQEGGVLVRVEEKNAEGVLVKTKTLQRDGQGVLVGVAYG